MTLGLGAFQTDLLNTLDAYPSTPQSPLVLIAAFLSAKTGAVVGNNQMSSLRHWSFPA